jgi:hypothetical protein
MYLIMMFRINTELDIQFVKLEIAEILNSVKGISLFYNI